tara:strand:+ start:773 stop:1309 length:537 start_codon:yes stop_codon:yes gene_type:complete
VKKSEIRKKIKKLREKNFSKNFQIDFQSIFKLLRKKKSKKRIIGGYYPYNYEINVIPIMEKFERLKYIISLPKIGQNSNMNFFIWSTNDPLNTNKYGIPEPINNKIIFPDVLLVPLVAYDKNFNRVGYGGGFYDRYLKRIKKIKNVLTIGLAFSYQKVKKIPIEKNDIKLDFIVTEKN